MLPSTTICAISTILFLIIIPLIYILRAAQPNPKRPPGPPGLPVIGNLHMLGTLPHRTLQTLSKKYGPIMSLQLGRVPAVVVSSPEAAELFLKTHDAVFANRPKMLSAQYTYGSEGVAFAEYGPYWRSVRKLCTVHLLSASKVECFGGLRKEEVGVMVEWVKKAAAAREVVDVTQKVGEVIEEITCKMILGRSKDDRFDLKGILQQIMRLSGTFNLSDFVPWLAPLDLQGLTPRMKETSKALDKMLEQMIEDHHHHHHQSGEDEHKDFIDILLSLINQPAMNVHDQQHSHTFDKSNIKGLLLDMIIGTTETSNTVIEWAISELLRHPRVMHKLQNDLKTIVGLKKMVEETDLPKLNYLDNVVKETLRLHPVVPLLAPHESMQDIEIQGYHIKKKTRVTINVWAIGRDPRVWSDNVDMFYPERFVNGNVDVRGKNFQLIPFGSGRRQCPGVLLALTTVKFVVAQLVHCFNWELPHGMVPKDLDMSEKFGLTIPRAKHLLALPTYRLLHEMYEVA